MRELNYIILTMYAQLYNMEYFRLKYMECYFYNPYIYKACWLVYTTSQYTYFLL